MNSHIRRNYWGILGLSLIVIMAATLTSAQIPQRKWLPGHVPEAVAGLSPLGRLDASNRLKLSISLPLHNQDALTNLLAQLYDPASPSYHHYLSPDEFDTRFGPTEQDYAAVCAFASNNGFTVTGRHPNHMLLEATATVSDIERAFSVTLRTYQHPTEHRTFFAPDTEPSIAANVPILQVGGLDNFARPHPKNLRHIPLISHENSKAQVGSGPNGNLAGLDYRAAYAPGTTLTGAGQSVGLLEFDGYYAGDITSYESQTGIPVVPLQIVLLDGFNGVPTTGANSGNGEVALDIEMAISMAPGLSNVVVYEADPVNGQFNDILQAMSTNILVKQFSCSWSSPNITTAQRTTMDNYFLKFQAQGQSFFNASGDSGAESGAINPPDDDPNITLVGGTALATAGPGGAWLSETVWNAQAGPGVAGSSGGISTIYGIPPYQQGVNMTTNHGSTTRRNSPDVAMVADNIFIVADNGQNETTAGTSASAPLWAGFAALANQQAAAVGVAPIGFINPALYHLGTNSTYAACFDDITVGNNTNGNASLWIAQPGYDLCTGLGSANGGSLIGFLTQPDGFAITPGRGAVANGPVGGPFTVSTQLFSLTNIGNTSFTWSLGTTSSWLNISTEGGTLTTGGVSGSVSLSLNPNASLLPAGVYTANLWFTNLTSGLVQLRQFTLQVGQDLIEDGGFEAGDFCYWTLEGNASIYTNNFVDNGTYTFDSPSSGNYFGAFGQVSTLAFLSQPIPTRAGQRYLLSLWLENPNGATPNQFQIQWNTNAASTSIVLNQLNMGAFGWSNVLVTVAASTNTAKLRLGFRNDNDFFALDNVSVLPVPLPAVQSAKVVSNLIQVAWAALPGVGYQVQYKTNLTQANWINLGGKITATSNPMTTSESLGQGRSQFYRVVVP